MRSMALSGDEPTLRFSYRSSETGESRIQLNHRETVPVICLLSCCFRLFSTKAAGTVPLALGDDFNFALLRAFWLRRLILLFTSLLAIPLAR